MPSVGPYELLEELGRGGMGAVYRARGPSGHVVALKLLSDPLDEDSRARFEREGAALRSLRHPHVVEFHALGFDRARPYLAMELVEGTSLEDRLRRGPLAWTEAIQLGEQLASALAHAHDRGVLHRDLKPANVLLRPDGSAVLTDFGIARQSGTTSMTVTGQLLGTPSFMSPEQALCQKGLTPATDVFSLGSTLYVAVTGAQPFVGATALATLVAVQTQAPAPPSTHAQGLPAEFEALILRCLAKEPGERPSALELRGAFAALAASDGPPARGKPWIVAAGATLALGIALGGATLALRAAPSSTAATPEPTALPDAGPQGSAAGDSPDAKLRAALKATPTQDWRRRQELLSTLVELHPQDAGLQLEHAEVLLDAERFDLGVAAVVSALAAPQPDRARAHRLRLELDLRRGRFQDAHTLARTLTRDRPDDLALTHVIARSLLGTRQFAASEEVFGLLERARYAAAWRVDHANLLRLRGKTAQALQVIKTAVQRHPDHLRTLLEALFLRVPPLTAAQFGRRSKDLLARFGPRPSVLAAVAYGHLLAGRVAAAREHVEAALAGDPGQHQALSLRMLLTANGRGHLSRAQIDSLLRDAAKAAERDPTTLLTARADYLSYLGRPEEALQILRDAPETPEIVLARAKAQRAVLFLGKAPRQQTATLLLETSGRALKLAEYYKRPDPNAPRLLRAEALAVLGRWTEAHQEATRIVRLEPQADLNVNHLLRAVRVLKKGLPSPSYWVAGTEADMTRAEHLFKTLRSPEALHVAQGVARASSPSSALHARALVTAAWAATHLGPGLARGWLALARAAPAYDQVQETSGVSLLDKALNRRRKRKGDSLQARLDHVRLLRRTGDVTAALEQIEALNPTPKRRSVWLDYLRTLPLGPVAKRRAILKTALARAKVAKTAPELGALAHYLASLAESPSRDAALVLHAEALAKAARGLSPSEPYAIATSARLHLLESAEATDVDGRKRKLFRAIKGFSLATHQAPLGLWYRQRAQALLGLAQLEPTQLDRVYWWSRYARTDLLRSLGRGQTDDEVWLELAQSTHLTATASPEPNVQITLYAQAQLLFERGLAKTPWSTIDPAFLLLYFEACRKTGAKQRAREVGDALLPLLRRAGRTRDAKRLAERLAELTTR